MPPPVGQPAGGFGYGYARPCNTCGQATGSGFACAFCGQLTFAPPGVTLASAGRRLGGLLLDSVLGVVTLGIGWLIWSVIVWSDGLTPAKQLLGMRVVKPETGMKATWGTMFLREVIGRWLGSIVSFFTLGIIYFMILWDKNNQELWDKVAGTVVVYDPNGVLR
jgi:uncharacterized RDD family membrane protein YckC